MVQPDADRGAVTSMDAWIGHQVYAEPAVTVAAALANDSVWNFTTTLPDPLPSDATVWLRLTTADGSVMELGRDAFLLADLPSK
jgi:hypothetical protein